MTAPSPHAPHVLHLLTTLDPKAGSGPSDALVRMSRAQARAGLRVSIVTADAPDAAESAAAPLRAAGIGVHPSGPGGGPFNKGVNAESTVRRVLAEGVDILHIHALWHHLPHFGAAEARRRGVPYLFRPAGMLEPWALTKGRLKKRLFRVVKADRDFRLAAAMHATANQEGRNIRALGFGNPVMVVGNGVDLEAYSPVRADARVEARWPALRGTRRLLFLARIDPVKGTLNLAEAWGRLSRGNPDWRLVIAGPDSDGHQADFSAALERAGALGTTLFTGPVYGDDKRDLLASCDAFVQPSFQENFGISIAESLASGRPVITTTGTPWHELVSRRCGWWVGIGAEPLHAAMTEAMGMGAADLDVMGARGRSLMEERYSWDTIARDLRAGYEWVLGRAPKPAFAYAAAETIPA